MKRLVLWSEVACTVHSWFNAKGIERGSLRASAYLYNTEDEVKLFAETLVEAVEALG